MIASSNGGQKREEQKQPKTQNPKPKSNFGVVNSMFTYIDLINL
jgi:hypothetical protein